MDFQGQTFPDRHLTPKRLDYKLSIYFNENFLKYTKKTFEDQCTRSGYLIPSQSPTNN